MVDKVVAKAVAKTAITGLILAGGAGRRMGGVDKGLIEYRGRPLVEHVIERLAPQVSGLIISANRHLEQYRRYGFAVVDDGVADFPGPLAGLAAGLAACATDWLLCVPCDCPDLPDDLAVRLAAAVDNSGGNATMAVATIAAGLQPTFQLCQRRLLPALQATLAADRRRVRAWCETQAAIPVHFDDADAFRNLNHPAELACVERPGVPQG